MGYKRKGLTVEGDNIEALRLLVEAAQKPYISVEEGRMLKPPTFALLLTVLPVHK